jgi:glyoxylase-like metal-dependent hydrolase (beta-lactamase superfamily II)
MRFDNCELDPVEAGSLYLDGGAMFGVVPRALWSRTNPPDEKNRIHMAMRGLLIRDGERVILVDTGTGHKDEEKFRAIYGMTFEQQELLRSLAALGVQPADVTDVVLTHLHFDHVGGAVQRVEGALEPVFPRAAHHVQRPQWEWAMKPSLRDRASYLPDNYLPLRDRELLRLHDGVEEPFPGIELLPMHGHTFGQQLVRVSRGGRSVIFCGDLIPMAAHVPAPYIMSYDLQPLVTLEEKTGFLTEAARRRDVLVFQHDPLCEAAIVAANEKGFFIEHRGTLDEMLAVQEGGADTAQS